MSRPSAPPSPPRLSVVIPTLDAAGDLATTLAPLAAAPVAEIVVVDGGSRDGTPALAAKLGCRVIEAPQGRGRQLAAGAAAATGDWLLFLHADTRLAPDWAAAAARFMADPESAARAAVFRFRLDDDARLARLLEAIVRLRVRVLGLAYGDQGLLLSRACHDRLGGFRPLEIMEDVDLIRRIGRRRLVQLGPTATTSAARYRRDGYGARMVRNAVCVGLFFAGVAPAVIARIYR